MSTFASQHASPTAPARSRAAQSEFRNPLTPSARGDSGAPGPFLEGGFEIRPIRPADAQLIAAATSYTSPETYYRRFHAAKSHFSADELTYLTEVDGSSHVALVAIARGTPPRLAAEARFITDPSNPRVAEVAICVYDPFRRRGLATEMLRRLHDQAASRGVTHLRAMVQCDNFPIHALLYHVEPDTRVDARYGSEIEYLVPVRLSSARSASTLGLARPHHRRLCWPNAAQAPRNRARSPVIGPGESPLAMPPERDRGQNSDDRERFWDRLSAQTHLAA